MRARWSSHLSFMLAAVGSSIGLGNIWKFPYEMGLHGGGTFLLVYLPAVFLVAFPLMLAELLIGRRAHRNPVDGIAHVAGEVKASSLWQMVAWLGMLAGFFIFSYYSVVAGWILFYIMKSLSGGFVGVPAEIVQNSFGALLHNKYQMLIWHSVFVLLVISVLARGMQRGLELAIRVLMPVFIALLVWLCVQAGQIGDFDRALQFVFGVDVSAINAELIVSAFTQALFSLSIGMGVLLMFGAYLRDQQSLFTGTATILVFDLIAAVLMALLIFSVVFAFGMSPDAGFGLIFQTLPVAFSKLETHNILFSVAFFSFLLVAALTSGFALLEPWIRLLCDRTSMSRRSAAWLVGIAAWGLGWLSIESFGDKRFGFFYFGAVRENGFFDFFNIITTHFMLPLSALLTAIFIGWKLSRTFTQETLDIRFDFAFKLWRFCTKIIAPIIITLVLYTVLFHAQ